MTGFLKLRPMELTVVCHSGVLHVSSTGNTISVWLEKFLVDLSRYHNEDICDYTTLNQSILGGETAERRQSGHLCT